MTNELPEGVGPLPSHSLHGMFMEFLNQHPNVVAVIPHADGADCQGERTTLIEGWVHLADPAARTDWEDDMAGMGAPAGTTVAYAFWVAAAEAEKLKGVTQAMG